MEEPHERASALQYELAAETFEAALGSDRRKRQGRWGPPREGEREGSSNDTRLVPANTSRASTSKANTSKAGGFTPTPGLDGPVDGDGKGDGDAPPGGKGDGKGGGDVILNVDTGSWDSSISSVTSGTEAYKNTTTTNETLSVGQCRADIDLILSRVQNKTVGAAWSILDWYDDQLEDCRGGQQGRNSDDLSWNFPGSLFFTLSMMTTIGYGLRVPETSLGKGLVCGVGFVGIIITSFCIGAFTAGYDRLLGSLLKRRCKRTRTPCGRVAGDGDACRQRQASAPHCRPSGEMEHRLLLLKVGVTLGLLVIYLIFLAVYAHAVEAWSGGDCFYFAFVRASGLGFGDYAMAHERTSQTVAQFLCFVPGLFFFMQLVQAGN